MSIHVDLSFRRFCGMLVFAMPMLFIPSVLFSQVIDLDKPSMYNGFFSKQADTTRLADSILIPVTQGNPLLMRGNTPSVSQNQSMLQSVPSSYLHPHIPNTFEVDRSKAVGEIPLQTGVSPTGANTYQVPIEVAPGRNGMQPDISIAYNSQGGNGVLGMGWAIGGLSSIIPVPQNRYYDGLVAPVLLSRYDQFMLDGMRFCRKPNQSDPVNCLELISEQGNIKALGYYVRVYDNYSDNIVGFFKVYYPNGQVAIYGYEDNQSSKLAYPLTKLTDASGNYVSYEYMFLNEHYYIEHIRYGSQVNNTLSDYGKLTFVYRPRSDAYSVFQAGKQVYENSVLDHIDCFNGTNQYLRTYTFTYQTDHHSLLTQINCTVGSQSLNPLKFYYGYDEPAGTLLKDSVSLSPFPNDYNLIINKGKFEAYSDDDGLIVYPYKQAYKPKHSTTSGWMGNPYVQYDNEYSSIQELYIYHGLKGQAATPQKLTAGTGFVQLLTADVDGDGNEEIIKVNHLPGADGFPILNFSTYKSVLPPDGQNPVLSSQPGFGFSQPPWRYVLPTRFITGDFNGDGKMELLAISVKTYVGDMTSGKEESKAWLIDLNSRTKLFEGFAFNLNPEDELFAVDIDGDGKTELCRIQNGAINFYKVTDSNGQYYFTINGPNPTISESNGKKILVGDINGDGKMDFLVSPLESYNFIETHYEGGCCANPDPGGFYGDCRNCGRPLIEPTHSWTTSQYVNMGNVWTIYLSKGNNAYFERIEQAIINREEYDRFVLQDMNGDGIPDLVRQGHYGALQVFMTHNGRINSLPDVDANTGYLSQLIPSNVAMRQYHAQLLTVKTNKVYKFAFTRNDNKQRLLTTAVNSFGVVHKADYLRLNETPLYGSSCYTKGAGAVYPFMNFNGPLFVVAKTQSFSGSNTPLSSESYHYTDAVIHLTGMGFRGFSGVRVSDELRGQTVSRIYDPYKYGVLLDEESPTTKIVYGPYDTSLAGNKKLDITLTKKIVTDKLKNVSVMYDYTYDAFGNPLQESVNYGSGNIITSQKTYAYYDNATTYLLGLPLEERTSRSSNGQSWRTRNVLAYDAQYRPVSQNSYVQDNAQTEKKVAENAWTYDTFGNILTKKIRTYTSTNWLTTTYEYDQAGHYMTKQTDPMGRMTRYANFNTLGQVQTITDYLGNVTTYSYDVFGSISQVQQANGVITTQGLSWEPAGSDILYSSTATATGSPASMVYFDALGRSVKQGVQGFNGDYNYTDKQYDGYGRLKKVSDPYTGTPSLWTLHEYDTYDRITKITAPNGNEIKYTYSGFTTTENNAGQTSSKTYNVLGELVQATDPGGTVSYTYRADGQPSKVQVNGMVTTLFEYNAYGQQTAINDPAAGRRTFSYDGLGNISSQVDASGCTSIFTYNAYGQPVQQIYNASYYSSLFNYSYDNYSRLKAISSTEGCMQNFTYDNLGRIASEKYTADNYNSNKVTFTKEYVYDKGKISTVKYSTMPGTPIQYLYNAYGYLYEIKVQNGQSIWKLEEVNRQGQPLLETLGNGVQQTYIYTPEGFNTERKAAKGAVVLQQQRYVFDTDKALMMSRTDMTRGLTESFEYDELQRLTTYGNSNVQYNMLGNITQKTDAGQYNYSLAGMPYAVTGISGNNQTIPPIMQDVWYTAFNRPGFIAEYDHEAEFTYMPGLDRAKMLLTQDYYPLLTRYYLGGNYEKDMDAMGVATTERIYVGGTAYNAPAVFCKENGQWKLRYIHRDHLGSITLVSDEYGQALEENSFDAWGRLRDPETLTCYGPDNQPALYLGRGFTGHEHLSKFGLINMNARLYDPVLGRFLAPDPYVQMPDFTQNFNRYTYALNNPLMFTDESGEFIHLILGGVIGGLWNLAFNAQNIHSFGQGLKFFGVGALGGALGAGVGGGISSAMAFNGSFAGGFMGTSTSSVAPCLISGAAIGGGAGFSAGFVGGFGNGLIYGESFGQALWGGAKAGVIGGLSSAAISGVIGGLISISEGGNFVNGTKISEFKFGVTGNTKIFENYNSTSYADLNDELLQLRMQDEYGISVGDYGIKSITTRTTDNYAVTTSEYYIKLNTGERVGGYARSTRDGITSIHISPYYTRADIVDFRAVAGHEFIHAFHNFSLRHYNNEIFSERVAYKYSYDVYVKNGRFTDAFSVMKGAMLHKGFSNWGIYPAQYKIPQFLRLAY